MDEEIPGVCDTKEEIPGVDDAEGILGVYHNATPGVNDGAPDTANESDEAEIKQTNVERTSDTMHLCRQPRT